MIEFDDLDDFGESKISDADMEALKEVTKLRVQPDRSKKIDGKDVFDDYRVKNIHELAPQFYIPGVSGVVVLGGYRYYQEGKWVIRENLVSKRKKRFKPNVINCPDPEESDSDSDMEQDTEGVVLGAGDEDAFYPVCGEFHMDIEFEAPSSYTKVRMFKRNKGGYFTPDDASELYVKVYGSISKPMHFDEGLALVIENFSSQPSGIGLGRAALRFIQMMLRKFGWKEDRPYVVTILSQAGDFWLNMEYDSLVNLDRSEWRIHGGF